MRRSSAAVLMMACLVGCSARSSDDASSDTDPGETDTDPEEEETTWGCGDDPCCPDGCPDPGPGTSCNDVYEAMLGFSEASPLGFSAEEFLQAKTGEYASTLTFMEDSVLAPWAQGAMYDLAVTVAFNGGVVRWVEVEMVGGEQDPECRNRMEIEVDLSFYTSDRSFDEIHTVIVEATENAAGTAFQQLFPPGLTGTFDAAGMARADAEISSLDLVTTLSDDRVGGWLMMEASVPDGEGAGAQYFDRVARWGDPVE